MARHNELGKEGERRAADYLRAHGYRVLDTNWRAQHSHHELDIVVMGDNRVVVVEVKTRSTHAHGEPLDAVDRQKVQALTEAAQSYVTEKRIDLPLRFDLIGIVDNEIVHIKNAFVPPARHH